MSRTEAIYLLKLCAPLATKLILYGVKTDLTRAELSLLRGYKKITREGSRWLGDPEVIKAAGINTSLLALLDFKNRLEIMKERNKNNHLKH